MTARCRGGRRWSARKGRPVADTPAERMRRSRLHKRGDHSTCLPRSCPEVGVYAAAGPLPPAKPAARLSKSRDSRIAVPVVPPSAPDGERRPGGIETAVVAFVESLPYRDPDPRALLGMIAVRLAQRVDETGALPAAVRELRVLLVQLVEVPNGPSGVVDEIRLRSAQRRLDSILATTAV
jgi:hypothetical protein